MERKVIYKNTEIFYTLTLKNVKNVNIRVHDNMVHVSANKKMSFDKIDKIVLSKGDFICKSLEKINSKNTVGKVDLNNFYFLGNKYKIELDFDAEYLVEIREYSNIIVKARTKEEAEKILQEWFENKVKEILPQFIDKVDNHFEVYGVKYSSIKYKYLKSRWGSCNNKNEIVFNIYLLSLPLDCIEYVVAHEFAHMLELNHSKEFYKILENYSPNYKEAHNKIKQYKIKTS